MSENTFPYIYGQNVEKEYPKVTMAIERITPEIAAQMMGVNLNNRDMKREPLKKAIEDDEWMLNGESIVFSDHGVLLDGQNRLNACINSGQPIDVVVVRGVPKEAQLTMDLGVKRQLQDYLKMDGYPNCSTLAAIATAMQRADAFGIESAFAGSNGSTFTVKSSYQFVKDNYESRILPLVSPTMRLASHHRGLMSGGLAVLLEAFQKAVPEDDYQEFYNQFIEQTPPCKSVMVLNSRIRANAASKTGRLPSKVIGAFIIKAFNAYMLGTEITCLKFTQGGAHPESFPEIYGSEPLLEGGES